MRSQKEIVLSSDELTIGAQRVAELDAEFQTYREQRRADNTKAAYRDDMRSWLRYCAAEGIPPASITSGTFGRFVEWMSEQGRAFKTMQRRVTGVQMGMKELGQPIPPEAVAAAREALEIERKRIAKSGESRGRGKATAFSVPDLRAISEACPDTLIGVRDRALVLMGFSIGARRHELADLLSSDVTEVAEGLIVHVRWSKTGRERWPKIPYGQHLATCPVRAWRAWLSASGLTEGRAFRRIDRHGRMHDTITPEGIGDAVSRAAARAGLTGRTAHGLRSGMATEGRSGGHDAVAIAEQGGWTRHSREMLGYMQVVDGWTDNPLRGIGL